MSLLSASALRLSAASARTATLLHAQRAAALSTSTALRNSSGSSAGSNSGNAPPTPPKGTDSSTSALDYKLNHPRPRPPSLPEIDPPKWSAEYAVTNIL
jgi:acetolactate synthase-1/3 small subunit